MFYNYTNQPFAITWGGVPYKFEPGQVYEKLAISVDGNMSVPLTDVVCGVFAKHLADKVLNTPALNANFKKNEDGKTVSNSDEQMMKVNMTNIDLLIQRALTAPNVEVSLPSFVDELPLMEEKEVILESEEPKAEKPKAKPGRKPKAKEEASPSEGVEFAV